MNLDNISAIKKLDKKSVAESIANLPKQITTSWDVAKKVKLPPTFGKAGNIIFCGMGGSNLASELVKRVFGSQIKVPMILVRSYNLPSFADKNSLIIIDSYSGNTEETVSCLNQAMKIKAKIICISSGGKIETLAKKNQLVHFKLNASLNPSGQPRYDVGSQLGTALNIFSRLKIITLKEQELILATQNLITLGAGLALGTKAKNNIAKKLSTELSGHSLYIVASEHLSANAHILANQINESAKQLASPYKIPELNHHFLEALVNPKRVIRNTAFVFLASSDYSPMITKRFSVTKKILDENSIANVIIKSPASGALNQSLEILAIGSWVSFYLAMINGVNPAEIPWVNYFKSELEK